MWSKKAINELDQYYPPCGECWICGFKDKRHRLWDTFLSQLNGGDSPELIARLYNTSIDHVKAVQRIKPFHRNNY